MTVEQKLLRSKLKKKEIEFKYADMQQKYQAQLLSSKDNSYYGGGPQAVLSEGHATPILQEKYSQYSRDRQYEPRNDQIVNSYREEKLMN